MGERANGTDKPPPSKIVHFMFQSKSHYLNGATLVRMSMGDNSGHKFWLKFLCLLHHFYTSIYFTIIV